MIVISFNDVEIFFEIVGFVFLIPTIQDKMWMYFSRNTLEVKAMKSNYLSHFPFRIGIKNLIEPHYSNYYNSKNRMGDAGILLVLVGLFLQFLV